MARSEATTTAAPQAAWKNCRAIRHGKGSRPGLEGLGLIQNCHQHKPKGKIFPPSSATRYFKSSDPEEDQLNKKRAIGKEKEET